MVVLMPCSYGGSGAKQVVTAQPSKLYAAIYDWGEACDDATGASCHVLPRRSAKKCPCYSVAASLPSAGIHREHGPTWHITSPDSATT